jgi:hypothetical protein
VFKKNVHRDKTVIHSLQNMYLSSARDVSVNKADKVPTVMELHQGK